VTAAKRVPAGARRLGRRAATAYGRATASLRSTPDFLLVGAQRCGTTSLFRALLSHPHVLRANFLKGVNYFDVNADKGMSWYRAHLPLVATARRHAAPGQDHAQVFEASGYYMFHPHAPRRIVDELPDVKVVAMVRDPVERAFSAYKHEFARGFETETLERALDLEDARVVPELDRMLNDADYQSPIYRHQAYRRRGQYAEQLQPFVEGLGRHRVHVVQSELFFTQPVEEYTRLLEFLDLPVVLPRSFDRYNPRPSAPMDASIAARLRQHFESHDAALEAFLHAPPSWR
jgi:hypothetical protein